MASVLSSRVDGTRGRSRGRHVWATSGRAHIEARGVHRPGRETLVDALERGLRAVEGVHWAEVNPVLAHVIVAFEEESVGLDDLVAVVDDVEAAHGVAEDDVLVEGWDHPGDGDPLWWGVVELGADAAGMVLGVVARAARLPRLPIEVAAALPALDNLPPVRRALEHRPHVEVGVVSVAALLQGLGQGTVGLVVDAGHRVMLLREAGARRAVWERVEPRLYPGPRNTHVAAFDRSPRPRPLPDGVVEAYAQRVSLGSLGLGAVAVAVTRNPRALVDVVLAAIPRAARLGREGFAAELGYGLAGRDVLVMEPLVLRRLDRIDTVVVDERLLEQPSAGGRALVASIRAAAQDFVVAGGGPDGWEHLEPDVVVAGNDELGTSVRRLQDEGRVVAVVSSRPGLDLAAADCGIGVTASDGHPPWGADVLCPNLHTAALVVDATALARTASRRAVTIAIAGSALATALAFGPAPGSGRRAVVATNAAALVALGAGAWTAATLARGPLPSDDGTNVAWHALGVDEVTALLGTGPAGLPAGDVEPRRTQDHRQTGLSFPTLLTQELANPLTVLLAAGGVLSTVAGSVTDGVLITGVLGVNAIVGATQRLRTEQAISRLGASVSSRLVRIRRDGSEHSVSPDELVDGDLVVLQAGDVVPADCRILGAASLETDESALTGESLPVSKQADAVASDTAVADRRSMAYAGTAIAAGRGEAIVVATGERTEGRRGMAEGARAPVSGVETHLENLTRKTVPLVMAAGGLLTGSSLLRGVPMREAVSTGVSLVAAAVPEGLPFLATVAQSGAARRLSRQGVLVRNARVLEALGRVDVLCFDKTGTLTEGRLQLRSVSDGELLETMPAIDGRRRLVLAAALRATPTARRHELPHPTDQVVVEGAAAVELGTELGARGWRKVASLPFAPSRGYHAVLGEAEARSLLSVKGAPEVVLPRCETWRRAEHVVALDDDARLRLDRHVERLAQQGLRVLAVAERHASGRVDLDDARVGRLELLGFVTVADIARPSAITPIAQLQRAGIAVVMLTGDHPSTAQAIASELGLLDGDVVSGPQLDQLTDAQLDALIGEATVFARVTPVHKVRIVQAFQRHGRVVAMTGDGANDAQAIRLADIGIAFGPRATPAARAAADLVVVDDRVETLITSIIEGRAMWASVRDALALLLGGNLGEVIFTTGVGLITGRSPLNARQLLAVNLLTDLAPAMAIALQPPLTRDVDLRREGPDTSLGSALARDVAVRAVATAGAAGAAWTIARFTGTPTRARTVALAALVGAQLGQTLVVGHRSPLVLGSGVLSVGALVGIVQTPGVSQFFGCRPLGPIGWTIAATAAGTATAGAAAASFFLAGTVPSTSAPQSTIDIRSRDAMDVEPAAAIAGA
jgi:cation-transporting P-type ATPase I